MAWVRIDDAFYDSKKWAGAPGDSIGLWVAAMAWCSLRRVDGRIRHDDARGLVVVRNYTHTVRDLERREAIVLDRDGFDLIDFRQHASVARQRIPEHVRRAVYARDGQMCVRCGSDTELTIDHIWPWSLGGSDDPANLQTLCRSCNCSKGARV